MISVVDDVLDDNYAKDISQRMDKLRWNYYSKSHIDYDEFHWSREAGESDNELIENRFEWVKDLWYKLKEVLDLSSLNVETYKRIYFNAHTRGMDPKFHKDDGDFTMIYYPKFANGSKWKWEWGGGTQVGDVVVDNVGNRALIFNAKSPHRALPVSDECTLLRSVIVFKMLEKNNGI